MSDFDPTDPGSYSFWATEHVRFADLDMLGHVNNKAYATYFETARVNYMTACDYRKEIRYPATLKLGVRLCKLGNSSLTLACAIFDGDVCASTSQSIAVRFDGETRKSKPFTPTERQTLESYL